MANSSWPDPAEKDGKMNENFMVRAAVRFYCKILEEFLTRTGWFVSHYLTQVWAENLTFVSAMRELNNTQRNGSLALAYLKEGLRDMDAEELEKVSARKEWRNEQS